MSAGGLRRAVPLPYSEASQLHPGSRSKGTWTVWATTGHPDPSDDPAEDPPKSISLTMYGTESVSEILPLQNENTKPASRDSNKRRKSEAASRGKEKTKKPPYQAGSTEEFKVDCGEIGELVKIRVLVHGASETSKPAWLLKRVRRGHFIHCCSQSIY